MCPSAASRPNLACEDARVVRALPEVRHADDTLDEPAALAERLHERPRHVLVRQDRETAGHQGVSAIRSASARPPAASSSAMAASIGSWWS